MRLFNSTNLWTWKTTALLSSTSPEATTARIPPPPLLSKLRGKLLGTRASRRAATRASFATPPPRPLTNFSAPPLPPPRPRLLRFKAFVVAPPSSKIARGGPQLPAAPTAPRAIAPAESARRAAAACGGENGTAAGAAAPAPAPDPVNDPDASRRRGSLLPIGDSAGVIVAVGSPCSARRRMSAGGAFSLTPFKPARAWIPPLAPGPFPSRFRRPRALTLEQASDLFPGGQIDERRKPTTGCIGCNTRVGERKGGQRTQAFYTIESEAKPRRNCAPRFWEKKKKKRKSWKSCGILLFFSLFAALER